MSNEYEEWNKRKITYLCESIGDYTGYITAEDLYQEFKDRLIKELEVKGRSWEGVISGHLINRRNSW